MSQLIIPPYNGCCQWGEGLVHNVGVPQPPTIPDSCSSIACPGGVVAQYWDLVVPTGAFAGCGVPRCQNWEGTFKLAFVSGCLWRSPTFTAGQAGCINVSTSRWDMLIGAGAGMHINNVLIQGPFGSGRGWFKTIASFDCYGPNTMAWDGQASLWACTFSSGSVSLTLEPGFAP